MKRALAALVVCCACLIALAADEAPEGWPFDNAEAQRRQQDCAAGLGTEVTRTLTLPGGGTLTLVLIPSGRFLIGKKAFGFVQIEQYELVAQMLDHRGTGW